MSRTELRIKLRIDFPSGRSLGPGKVSLLEQIERDGSLSEAARALGLSYRRAWLLLDDLNKSFLQPVATSAIGGKRGGGVTLTDFGRQLAKSYRALEKRTLHATQRLDTQLAAPSRPARRRSPARGSG